MTLPKAQKCKYDDRPADRRIFWAERMAYVPVCSDDCQARAVRKIGGPNEVDAIERIPAEVKQVLVREFVGDEWEASFELKALNFNWDESKVNRDELGRFSIVPSLGLSHLLDYPSGYPWPIVEGAPPAAALPAPKDIKPVSLRPGDVLQNPSSKTVWSIVKQPKLGTDGYWTIVGLKANGDIDTWKVKDGLGITTIARTPQPKTTAKAKKDKAALLTLMGTAASVEKPLIGKVKAKDALPGNSILGPMVLVDADTGDQFVVKKHEVWPDGQVSLSGVKLNDPSDDLVELGKWSPDTELTVKILQTGSEKQAVEAVKPEVASSVVTNPDLPVGAVLLPTPGDGWTAPNIKKVLAQHPDATWTITQKKDGKVFTDVKMSATNPLTGAKNSPGKVWMQLGQSDGGNTYYKGWKQQRVKAIGELYLQGEAPKAEAPAPFAPDTSPGIYRRQNGNVTTKIIVLPDGSGIYTVDGPNKFDPLVITPDHVVSHLSSGEFEKQQAPLGGTAQPTYPMLGVGFLGHYTAKDSTSQGFSIFPKSGSTEGWQGVGMMAVTWDDGSPMHTSDWAVIAPNLTPDGSEMFAHDGASPKPKYGMDPQNGMLFLTSYNGDKTLPIPVGGTDKVFARATDSKAVTVWVIHPDGSGDVYHNSTFDGAGNYQAAHFDPAESEIVDSLALNTDELNLPLSGIEQISGPKVAYVAGAQEHHVPVPPPGALEAITVDQAAMNHWTDADMGAAGWSFDGGALVWKPQRGSKQPTVTLEPGTYKKMLPGGEPVTLVIHPDGSSTYTNVVGVDLDYSADATLSSFGPGGSSPLSEYEKVSDEQSPSAGRYVHHSGKILTVHPSGAGTLVGAKGGMHDLDADEVHAELAKPGWSPAVPEEEPTVGAIPAVTEKWHDIGGNELTVFADGKGILTSAGGGQSDVMTPAAVAAWKQGAAGLTEGPSPALDANAIPPGKYKTVEGNELWVDQGGGATWHYTDGVSSDQYLKPGEWAPDVYAGMLANGDLTPMVTPQGVIPGAYTNPDHTIVWSVKPDGTTMAHWIDPVPGMEEPTEAAAPSIAAAIKNNTLQPVDAEYVASLMPKADNGMTVGTYKYGAGTGDVVLVVHKDGSGQYSGPSGLQDLTPDQTMLELTGADAGDYKLVTPAGDAPNPHAAGPSFTHLTVDDADDVMQEGEFVLVDGTDSEAAEGQWAAGIYKDGMGNTLRINPDGSGTLFQGDAAPLTTSSEPVKMVLAGHEVTLGDGDIAYLSDTEGHHVGWVVHPDQSFDAYFSPEDTQYPNKVNHFAPGQSGVPKGLSEGKHGAIVALGPNAVPPPDAKTNLLSSTGDAIGMLNDALDVGEMADGVWTWDGGDIEDAVDKTPDGYEWNAGIYENEANGIRIQVDEHGAAQFIADNPDEAPEEGAAPVNPYGTLPGGSPHGPYQPGYYKAKSGAWLKVNADGMSGTYSLSGDFTSDTQSVGEDYLGLSILADQYTLVSSDPYAFPPGGDLLGIITGGGAKPSIWKSDGAPQPGLFGSTEGDYSIHVTSTGDYVLHHPGAAPEGVDLDTAKAQISSWDMDGSLVVMPAGSYGNAGGDALIIDDVGIGLNGLAGNIGAETVIGAHDGWTYKAPAYPAPDHTPIDVGTAPAGGGNANGNLLVLEGMDPKLVKLAQGLDYPADYPWPQVPGAPPAKPVKGGVSHVKGVSLRSGDVVDTKQWGYGVGTVVKTKKLKDGWSVTVLYSDGSQQSLVLVGDADTMPAIARTPQPKDFAAMKKAKQALIDGHYSGAPVTPIPPEIPAFLEGVWKPGDVLYKHKVGAGLALVHEDGTMHSGNIAQGVAHPFATAQPSLDSGDWVPVNGAVPDVPAALKPHVQPGDKLYDHYAIYTAAGAKIDGDALIVHTDGSAHMLTGGKVTAVGAEHLPNGTPPDEWKLAGAPAPEQLVGTGPALSDKAKAAAKQKPAYYQAVTKPGSVILLPNGGSMSVQSKVWQPTQWVKDGHVWKNRPGQPTMSYAQKIDAGWKVESGGYVLIGTPSIDTPPEYLSKDENGNVVAKYKPEGAVMWVPKSALNKKSSIAIGAKPPSPTQTVVTPPAAPVVNAQPTAAPKADSDILSTIGWKQVGPQGGSNPGGLFESPDGIRYYVKSSKHGQTRTDNEVVAARLYTAAGIAIPEVRKATITPELGLAGSAKIGVASRIVEGKKNLASKYTDPAYRAKIVDGFAVDAWLANWDAAGTGKDNMIEVNGEPLRVDVGGSLLYRAQGTPKGDAFGDKVTETKTLLDHSKNADAADVYGKVTKAELRASFEKHVAPITPDQIDKIVDENVSDPADRALLKQRLKARRLDLAAQVGIAESHLPENVVPAYPLVDMSGAGGHAVPYAAGMAVTSDIVTLDKKDVWFHRTKIKATQAKPGMVLYLNDPGISSVQNSTSLPWVITKIAPKPDGNGAGKDGIWGKLGGVGDEHFMFIQVTSHEERDVWVQTEAPPGWKPPPPPPPPKPGEKLVLTGKLKQPGSPPSPGAADGLDNMRNTLHRDTELGNAYKLATPEQRVAFESVGWDTQGEFVKQIGGISGNWDSSSNSSIQILAFHHAVAVEFGLEDTVAWPSEHANMNTKKQVQEHFLKFGAAYQAAARCIYQNTQNHLAKRGVEYVKVWRGFSFSKPGGGGGTPAPPWAWSNGVHTDVVLRPLSSGQWVNTWGGNVKIIGTIPRELIFSTIRTGPGGYDGEYETVLLGVKNVPWQVTGAVQPSPGYTAEKFYQDYPVWTPGSLQTPGVQHKDFAWTDDDVYDALVNEDMPKVHAQQWPFVDEDGDEVTSISELMDLYPDLDISTLPDLVVTRFAPQNVRDELAELMEIEDEDGFGIFDARSDDDVEVRAVEADEPEVEEKALAWSLPSAAEGEWV